MWQQPRDRCMPLPTSHTMNLNLIHCYQSAINPSALCSGLSSDRWIHHYSGHLCVCVLPSQWYSYHEAHQRLSIFIMFPEPSRGLRPPLVLIDHSRHFLVPAYLCSAPAMSRLRGKSKRGSAWHQNRSRLEIRPPPAPHPRIARHPPRQPLRSSPLIVSVVSRLSPRPMRVELNGSTSWGTHWASTQGLYQTWPPLRNPPWSSLPIHPRTLLLRLRQCNRHRSNLHAKVSSAAMRSIRSNPTPAQTALPAQNYKTTLQFCKDLVFEVRKEVDDLRFRLEVLDRKGTQILQMLSSLHGSCHPSEATPNAPGDSETILVPALHRSPVDDAAPDLAPTLQAPTLDTTPCYTSTT
jgi:hypothetical protein